MSWAEVYALIPREVSTVPEGWVVLDSAGAYRLETDDYDEALSIARDLGTTPLVVARSTTTIGCQGGTP